MNAWSGASASQDAGGEKLSREASGRRSGEGGIGIGQEARFVVEVSGDVAGEHMGHRLHEHPEIGQGPVSAALVAAGRAHETGRQGRLRKRRHDRQGEAGAEVQGPGLPVHGQGAPGLGRDIGIDRHREVAGAGVGGDAPAGDHPGGQSVHGEGHRPGEAVPAGDGHHRVAAASGRNVQGAGTGGDGETGRLRGRAAVPGDTAGGAGRQQKDAGGAEAASAYRGGMPPGRIVVHGDPFMVRVPGANPDAGPSGNQVWLVACIVDHAGWISSTNNSVFFNDSPEPCRAFFLPDDGKAWPNPLCAPRQFAEESLLITLYERSFF